MTHQNIAKCRVFLDLTRSGVTASKYTLQVWIGIYYDGAKWQWTDGTPIDYTHWRPGEPNYDGGRTGQSCGQIYSDWESDIIQAMSLGQWNDWLCNTTMRAFVCKKESHFS